MPEANGKAVHTIELIGHVLRYATPILLLLIGYTYVRDQDINKERHDLLMDKMSLTQSTIREVDKEIDAISKELATRGVRINYLEGEAEAQYLLINDHESRIRNLEISR